MTDYLSDIVTRVLAQCEDAVPAKEGFDYFGGDYPNFPYWKVGDTSVSTERFGSELRITCEITAHLYGGKTTENNDGVIEKQLRAHIPTLIAYFADRLDLTSAAYPLPYPYVIENGVFLTPIRKRIIGNEPSFFVLELIFNVPLLA